MPNKQAAEKLKILARKVKSSELTTLEAIRLEQTFDRSTGSIRHRAENAISESLNFSRTDVLTKLAASDDTDRIIRDIVDTLDRDD